MGEAVKRKCFKIRATGKISPYSVTSRKGFKNKQWNFRIYCFADRNVERIPCVPSPKDLLIETGIGPNKVLTS